MKIDNDRLMPFVCNVAIAIQFVIAKKFSKSNDRLGGNYD
jgi:hypothetical protein